MLIENNLDTIYLDACATSPIHKDVLARIVEVELAKELINTFIDAQFTGESRHVRRVGKITAIEAKHRENG